MAKRLKKYEYRFVNRWKQYTTYRIDFAPAILVTKQNNYKTIPLEWFGFTVSIQINL